MIDLEFWYYVFCYYFYLDPLLFGIFVAAVPMTVIATMPWWRKDEAS